MSFLLLLLSITFLLIIALFIFHRKAALRGSGRWSKRVPTEHFANGSQIHLSAGETRYQIFGQQLKDPKGLILCVHGFSSPSQLVWAQFATSASENGYIVLTYDLYGRGGSEMPNEPQTAALFSSQLAELLLLLRSTGDLPSNVPTTVVGFSMGGAIATKFVSTFQPLVDSLILLAPAGLGARVPRFVPILDIPVVFDTIIRLLSYVSTQSKVDFLYGIKEDPLWEGDVASFVEKFKLVMAHQFGKHPGYIESLLATLKDFPLADMENDFKRLPSHIPVHFVWGDMDAKCPMPSENYIQSIVRHAQVHVLHNVGHKFILSRALTTNHILLKILEEHNE